MFFAHSLALEHQAFLLIQCLHHWNLVDDLLVFVYLQEDNLNDLHKYAQNDKTVIQFLVIVMQSAMNMVYLILFNHQVMPLMINTLFNSGNIQLIHHRAIIQRQNNIHEHIPENRYILLFFRKRC